MNDIVYPSLNKLIKYCESVNFQGYDPYDSLNSSLKFSSINRYIPIIITQIQKKNPVNIRPFLGIKKDFNPKGMGLFLKAYCVLFKKTGKMEYLTKADWIFTWLCKNYSKGYSGMAWGYNFDWADTSGYKKAFLPSSVVTAHVIDGIFSYYQQTKNKIAKQVILSASQYIINDLPISYFDNGISFSYTSLSKDVCYNASLLAAEVLSMADFVSESKSYQEIIKQAMDFVISKQNNNGSWFYSFYPASNKERKQIDFHQGFILCSLQKLNDLILCPNEHVPVSLYNGLRYYKEYQFSANGRSFWRIPKRWPVDIHNQSQGIITFTFLKNLITDYKNFAHIIADWTITNMQSEKGYFYYRKNRLLYNKIPYIRWAQAWMFLALSELLAE